MEKQPPNPVVETREELIASLQPDSEPCLRLARFLKPSPSAIIATSPPPPPSIKQTQNGDVYQPLRIELKGWRLPQVNYKNWVVSMSAKHRPVWENAGIYDAIISSTYEIKKLDDLVVGFATNWCPKTKSFVFEWGECSISLEDVHVIGGYSILGDSVLTPVQNDAQQAMDSLMSVRRELYESSAKKVSQQKWMKMFMNADHQYEHEGFLAYWLSMFVFPHAQDSIGKHVISIAVNLARGTKIALAPAVLASIYRDLSLVVKKKKDVARGDIKSVTVWAPFQLVLVWIWERFVHLRPKLYTLRPVEPRMVRWVVHDKSEVVDSLEFGRHLDWNSFGNEFQWRPYAKEVNNNIIFTKFYGTKIKCVGSDDDELQSFARCLRPCELVGTDCIEQYLPHRVSMQFGFDQEIPLDIRRSNGNHQVAWKSYSKHIDVTDLFFPSLDAAPGVTARYLEWRKLNISSVTSPASKDKFKRVVKADGVKISSTSKSKKLTKKKRVEDDEDSSQVLSHLIKTRKMTPRKDDSDSFPTAPPGFELSSTKRNKIGESAVKSRLIKLAGRQYRKLNDVVDDSLSGTEVFPSGKRFKNNGLPDDYLDEDHVPIREVLLSSKKHKYSTVIMNNSNTSSVMSGTHLQGSSSLHDGSSSFQILKKENPEVELDFSLDADDQVPLSELLKEKEMRLRRPSNVILDTQFVSASILHQATNVEQNKEVKLEGVQDIFITVEKHVSNCLPDFNENEEDLNKQQSSSKASEVAVDIYENHDKKEKPWTKIEQIIELMATQVNILKAAARARGHYIP